MSVASTSALREVMMDRAGTPNHERIPYRSAIVDGKTVFYCRVCGKILDGQKSSFCGRRCLRDFFMQTDWQRVRRVVYERDGGQCMECGKYVGRDDYHVDHIVPVSKGGAEWELSNLELLCPKCNLTKGAK